jgi:hypothetical protein
VSATPAMGKQKLMNEALEFCSLEGLLKVWKGNKTCTCQCVIHVVIPRRKCAFTSNRFHGSWCAWDSKRGQINHLVNASKSTRCFWFSLQRRTTRVAPYYKWHWYVLYTWSLDTIGRPGL